MNLENMTLADVEARLAEIESELETRSGEELDALKAEVVSLQERKTFLVDLEERQANAKALEENRAEDIVTIVEERKEEKKMELKEYRNSEEYINAFAEYIKTGKDDEVRALLTTNVGDAGEIAVPDFVYEIIKTDWTRSGIMSLVKKIAVQGNMKVQFELTAGDAVIHNEGSGAVSEESLTLGVVTLVPESIKKWISVSDEALDMRGQAFLEYIYDELTYRIALKAEKVLLDKIAALSTSASENAVNAKKAETSSY